MNETVGPPIRHPWEGSRWRDDGLLILGDSHYHFPGEDPDDPNKTIATVRNVIDGQKLRFFAAVERVVTGAPSRGTKPVEFLPTIAYANFCQGSADGPAGARTPEMWARGVAAFPGILGKLKPRRMVVFSTGSWNRFRFLEGVSWQHERNIEIGGSSQDTGFLSAVDGSFRVYCTNVGHPSTRRWGDAADWHRFVADFLRYPV